MSSVNVADVQVGELVGEALGVDDGQTCTVRGLVGPPDAHVEFSEVIAVPAGPVGDPMSFSNDNEVKPMFFEQTDHKRGLGFLFFSSDLHKSVGIPSGTPEIPTPGAARFAKNSPSGCAVLRRR